MQTPARVWAAAAEQNPGPRDTRAARRDDIQTLYLNSNKGWFSAIPVEGSELTSPQHLQPHCAVTATLGADAGGPRGTGTWGAAFWLLSAERRSRRSV